MNIVIIYLNKRRYSNIKPGDAVKVIGTIKGQEFRLHNQSEYGIELNDIYEVVEVRKCNHHCNGCNHPGISIIIIRDNEEMVGFSLCGIKLADVDGVEYV